MRAENPTTVGDKCEVLNEKLHRRYYHALQQHSNDGRSMHVGGLGWQYNGNMEQFCGEKSAEESSRVTIY